MRFTEVKYVSTKFVNRLLHFRSPRPTLVSHLKCLHWSNASTGPYIRMYCLCGLRLYCLNPVCCRSQAVPSAKGLIAQHIYCSVVRGAQVGRWPDILTHSSHSSNHPPPFDSSRSLQPTFPWPLRSRQATSMCPFLGAWPVWADQFISRGS